MAKKPTFKIGDEVIIRATVTIPDGDERTGDDTVVVQPSGYGMPLRLRVEDVERTGRSEGKGYFLDDS